MKRTVILMTKYPKRTLKLVNILSCNLLDNADLPTIVEVGPARQRAVDLFSPQPNPFRPSIIPAGLLGPAAHGMGAPKASRGDRECKSIVPRPRSPFVISKEAKNLTHLRRVRDVSENPETYRIHPAAELCSVWCTIPNLVP